ncbi:MAG: hypothetical protein M3464_01350 [Chloroflexota bacterium]|nr:hypothetical protein [Chloroflexota bacterium]
MAASSRQFLGFTLKPGQQLTWRDDGNVLEMLDRAKPPIASHQVRGPSSDRGRQHQVILEILTDATHGRYRHYDRGAFTEEGKRRFRLTCLISGAKVTIVPSPYDAIKDVLGEYERKLPT